MADFTAEYQIAMQNFIDLFIPPNLPSNLHQQLVDHYQPLLQQALCDIYQNYGDHSATTVEDIVGKNYKDLSDEDIDRCIDTYNDGIADRVVNVFGEPKIWTTEYQYTDNTYIICCDEFITMHELFIQNLHK